MHGVDWDTLAKEIPTKEKTQIKNYYQNYKQRLELDQIELPHSAKHPKPSRGPSRASTPRPGELATAHLPSAHLPCFTRWVKPDPLCVWFAFRLLTHV